MKPTRAYLRHTIRRGRGASATASETIHAVEVVRRSARHAVVNCDGRPKTVKLQWLAIQGDPPASCDRCPMRTLSTAGARCAAPEGVPAEMQVLCRTGAPPPRVCPLRTGRKEQ